MIADNLTGRVPRLREENARQVYLTAAQVKALATSAPNSSCRAAIMLAAYTGLRAGELLRLGACPSRAATLSVQISKSGKPRAVPIAGPVRPYLSALPLGCSYRLLIKWFHAARKKAGMKHVHFHDLRHSCASMLINEGVDLYTVGKILGHSSPQTTARYAHLSDASLQKAMGKLR
jgi:integrase